MRRRLAACLVCGMCVVSPDNDQSITPQSGGIFGTWNGTLGSGDFRIKPSADNAGNNNRFRTVLAFPKN